jgi:hypothetical protein
MKTMTMMRSVLIAAGGLLAFTANAQIQLFLQEQEIVFDEANLSAWVFPVARDFDEALDDLDRYCKDRSDIRMKKGGDNQVIAEKISIPSIASKRGDLIGQCFPTESYNAMAILFRLGYDISLNQDDWTKEMNNLRIYAKDFMSYHYDQSYARRIDAVDKEIRSLERDVNQNERKIRSLDRKIEGEQKNLEEETDSAKLGEIRGEIATLNSDRQELQDNLPRLRLEIEQLQGNVEKLRNESIAFQNAIGPL